MLLHRQVEVPTGSWKVSKINTHTTIHWEFTFQGTLGEVSQCSHVHRVLLTGKEFQGLVHLVPSMGVWYEAKECLLCLGQVHQER